MNRMPARRRLLVAVPLIAASTVLLTACSGGSSGAPKDAGQTGTVHHSAAPKGPLKLDPTKVDACAVLPKTDAETLVKTKLDDPIHAGNPDVASCTYTGPTSGPVAQVEVYIGDGAKQQLAIDHDELKHKFTQPTGLGDEAWQEEGWIWSRVGETWISIRIVRLEDSAQFVKPLQTAMGIALRNLPAS